MEEGGTRLAKRLRETTTKKTSLQLTFVLGFAGSLGRRKDRHYLSAVTLILRTSFVSFSCPVDAVSSPGQEPSPLITE